MLSRIPLRIALLFAAAPQHPLTQSPRLGTLSPLKKSSRSTSTTTIPGKGQMAPSLKHGMAGRVLLAIALVAVALAGCLGGPSSEGADGPSASTPDDGAGPVETFSPAWPALDEAVIRPGVKIVAGPIQTDVGPVGELSGHCTANFVFSTPDNQTLYLGTASHCFANIGAALGDPVSIAAGAVTGTLVYCSWGTVDETETCPDKTVNDEGWDNDFALVELPVEARTLVHPAMLHWGGPTGLLKSPPAADVHVLNFGNTSLRDADQNGPGSDAADAREGLTAAPLTPFAGSPEWITYVRFTSPGIPGDSGSGVILADGTALGILIRIATNEGANAVTNLSPAIEYLHNNTDLRIELKTWATLADPILPGSATDEGAPRALARRA